jgi:formate hydrogenlyase subunit 3/multisubunit Na+/H+ antiporter MnhD subunit
MPDVYKLSTFQEMVLSILAIVIMIIAVGCIYTFIRSIFFFIFSQGKEDKIKAGRNSIRYMIIGIILTIFLLFFFPMILKGMNVQWSEQYTARNIVKKASDLLKNLMQVKDVIKKSQENSEYRGDLYYDVSDTNYDL